MRASIIKRVASAFLSLMVVMMIIATDAYAVEQRYIDLFTAECHLDINQGVACCRSKAVGYRNDYVYTIHMVLYQDDEDYAEWDSSGISIVQMNETCYVTHGHEYYVGIHIKVYDPDGNFIEQAIDYTTPYYYE